MLIQPLARLRSDVMRPQPQLRLPQGQRPKRLVLLRVLQQLPVLTLLMLIFLPAASAAKGEAPPSRKCGEGHQEATAAKERQAGEEGGLCLEGYVGFLQLDQEVVAAPYRQQLHMQLVPGAGQQLLGASGDPSVDQAVAKEAEEVKKAKEVENAETNAAVDVLAPDTIYWFAYTLTHPKDLVEAMLIAVIIALVVTVGYEALISSGLIYIDAGLERRPLQACYVLACVATRVQMSSVIPMSLSLCKALGESAAMSGLMISIINLACGIGAIIGKKLVSPPLNYPRTRLLIIFALMMMGVCDLGWCFALQAHSHFSGPGLYWLLTTTRFIAGFFVGFLDVGTGTAAIAASPTNEISTLQTLAQAGRNLGLFMGPVISSIAIVALQREDGRGNLILRNSAAPVVIVAIVCALMSAALALVLPRKLPSVETVEGATRTRYYSESAPSEPEEGEEVEDTPLQAARKSVVFNVELYNFERTLTIAAIEVSTTMIFQVQYHMTPTTIGLLFGIMCIGAVIVNVGMALWMRGYPGNEMPVMVVLSVLSWLAALGYFDIHGPWWILVAGDTLIYAFANTANGVADGFAVLNSTPGTFWSVENFLMMKTICGAIAGTIAGPFARGLVASTGRLGYAIAQFTIIAFGLITVGKTSYKLIKIKHYEEEEEEEMKSPPGSQVPEQLTGESGRQPQESGREPVKP